MSSKYKSWKIELYIKKTNNFKTELKKKIIIGLNKLQNEKVIIKKNFI